MRRVLLLWLTVAILTFACLGIAFVYWIAYSLTQSNVGPNAYTGGF